MESYQSAYDNFQWPRPSHFNFSRDVIDRWAEQEPEKLAMLWVDDNGQEVRRSFKDISEASKRIANALSQQGLQRGDRLVLMLGRQIAWWEVFTACLRMGVVVSPGTVQLSSKDIAYRINTADARCVVTDSANAQKFDEVASLCPNVSCKVVVEGERENWLNYDQLLQTPADFECVDTAAEDEAMCYFTSGTTGFPKMCIHSHSYALGHETTGKYWLDLKSDDLHWNLSDTGWAKAAWSSYFAPWLQGAALFTHHTSGFDPVRSLELMEQYPITTFCGAPTIYRVLVQQDLSSRNFQPLRHCVSAGEPLNPEVIDNWREATGLTIRDGYGQTETVVLCGSFPSIEARFGSMGKPAPGIELAVVDEDGKVVDTGCEGDIAVKVKPEAPQGLFLGYKNEPEKTAATFRGDWYITGDRATVDEDGYFWFVSRNDDVILSSGYRIGPFEVESALIEHPAVIESAVVSSPDPDRGEVVKAFVVLSSEYQASDDLMRELQNHVKSVTAPYKYPRKLEFCSELPKTVSGKIRRVELREDEWAKHKV